MDLKTQYIAIFYDRTLPKTYYYAMYKRVSEKTWANLLDGVMPKEVELRQNDEAPIIKYRVVEHRTFQIFTMLENQMYAVFDCERIKTHSEPLLASRNSKKSII